MDLAAISSFTSEGLLWLTLGSFFVAAFALGWLGLIQGRSFYGDYQAVFLETSSNNLEDMFLFVDPHRLFLFNVLALVLVPLPFLYAIGWPPALIVFLVVLIAPLQLYKSMRRKRLKRFEAQLPEALIMVTGALASGASLSLALEALVREQPPPLSQEFMLFVREQRIGVEFEQSLRHMERRLPLGDFYMFTAALRIARETGGNLGEILDTLADTLRRKAAMEGKIKALTAQGTMQGYVMTALPIFLGILLYFLEPQAMGKLFTTPLGWGVVGLVLVMEVLGYIIIRRVVSIDV
jgi:tight adherence protein B